MKHTLLGLERNFNDFGVPPNIGEAPDPLLSAVLGLLLPTPVKDLGVYRHDTGCRLNFN